MDTERKICSKNFNVDEFVDIRTYLTEDCNGIHLVDPKIINCTQLLRDKYGKSITVNTWWRLYLQLVKQGKTQEEIIETIENSRKVSKWSGLRGLLCKIGAKASMHKKGKATDSHGDPEAFMEIVEENAKEFYDLGLRRLEGLEFTPSWFHMDLSTRNHKPGTIRVIGPKSFIRNIIVNG